MKLQPLFTPAALALAITMATAPVLAQSDGNEGRRGQRNRTARTTESGNQDRGSRGDVAVRRSTAQPDSGRDNRAQAQSRPSDNGAYGVRPDDNRGYRAQGNDTRGNSPRQNANRSYGARQDNDRRYDTRGYNDRGSNNRAYDARRYDNRGYDGRRDNSWRDSNRDYGWRGNYDRNSWRSRVRFGLGVSIFSGRPFSFRFDYGWRPGFDYRYPIRQGVAYGGMSFLLDPDYAEVYIDGNFVGIARDFGGQPVPVAAGYHRIELYAQGFEPVAFDINVFPGQVIPYRGSLGQIY